MKPIPMLLITLATLGAAYILLLASPLGRQAQVATGYAARITCACRYIANRTPESCKTDLEPGTEIARLTESPKTQSITASIPLLATSTATYTRSFGCVLAP